MAGESRVRQMDVPANLPAMQLATTFTGLPGWGSDQWGRPVTYELEVHPPGRVLRPDETLAQAGCTDGVWIVARPRDILDQRPTAGYQFRRIDFDDERDAPVGRSQLRSRSDQVSPSPTRTGYIWRRIDADDE
jgi:hypothetical protein